MRQFRPLPHKRVFDPRPLRVQVCSPQDALRTALQHAVERQVDMQLHSVAASPIEAGAQIERETPDIILLNIDMSHGRWKKDVTRLTGVATEPGLPAAVIVLSAYFDEECLYALFAFGAKGYLLIEEWPDEVLSAVRRTLWGKPVISESVLHALAPPRRVPLELNRDDVFLLRMVSRGFTDIEIAYHLHLTTEKVRGRIAHLCHVLAVTGNRADLVAWAWRHGQM